MRDYGIVLPVFYSQKDYLVLSDAAHRLIGMLMGSNHGNLIGCFRLTPGLIKDGTGWSEKKAKKIIFELQENNFLKFDEKTNFVFLCNYLNFGWQPIQNPNQGKAAAKLFFQIPQNFEFLNDIASALLVHEKNFEKNFANKLRRIVGKEEIIEETVPGNTEEKKLKTETLSKRFANPYETVSKPFQNRSETVSKPVTVTGSVNSNNKYKNIYILSEQTSCSSEDEGYSLPPQAAIIFIPLKDGTEYPVSKSYADEMQKLFPDVNVEQKLRDIRAWNISNPKRRKERSGILKHINWCLTQEQKQKTNGAPKKWLKNDFQKSNHSRHATLEENLRVGRAWLCETGNSEAERFVVMMCGMAEQYHQKRLSKELFQLYWKDLKYFKPEAIEQALNIHTKTPGDGKFMPLPAALIQIIKTKAKEVAEEGVLKFLTRAEEVIEQKNQKYQQELRESSEIKTVEQLMAFHQKSSRRIKPDFIGVNFEDGVISKMMFHGNEISFLLKMKREELVNKYSAYLIAKEAEVYLAEEKNSFRTVKAKFSETASKAVELL